MAGRVKAMLDGGGEGGLEQVFLLFSFFFFPSALTHQPS